jgi:hypothetical protein
MMSPMRDIRPTTAIPAPMPAFAPEESPEEDVAVEDGAPDEDVGVTSTMEVEIGVDVLGLEPELELELDEDVVDVVDTKSEAWYRIETP